ncbi:MAG: lysophospholipid acyltransferase family protein [Candidatus Eisenbacteria sp.]|nr:lysophospholipid acyltransferase family protein [Candidatus Eisenbacteria bacterium]
MWFHFALRLGLLLAHLLPERWIMAIAIGLGRVAALISPARHTVARNLAAIAAREARSHTDSAACEARSYPRPADVFEAYGRYWGEFLILVTRPERSMHLPIRVEGLAHLEQAAAAGPICLLSAHLGNWDLLAHWLSTRLPQLTTVSEALEPDALFQLFVRLRARCGIRVLAVNGSGRSLYRLLREGRAVGLVADRVFGMGTGSGSGKRPARFLGGWRHFPSAGMDLARRAGAVLLPAFLLREKAGYVIKICPPLPEGEDPVAAFGRVLEQGVLDHPEQWCMLYPLHDAEEARAEVTGCLAKGAAIP